MTLPIGALGPSAYWYLARGSGVVSLLLLTAVVVLGILGSLRFAAPRWPRFAIDSLHRDLSLLAVVFLVLHIITSVLDSFAPIRLIDAVIPFVSLYRPLWMGFGALAFDLFVALIITSLVRRRLGYRSWRAIHWLAYASWPIAVLHGLGSGSDTKQWWMLAITAGCLAAVLIAVWVRIARSESSTEGLRGGAIALTVLTPLGLAIFALAGPLAPHWAARAGTPASLLGKTAVPVASVTVHRGRGHAPHPASATATLKIPFSAKLDGTVTQKQESGGAIVDLAMRLSGGAQGRLRVRLAGAPLDGGGLSMTGSQVDLLAKGLPAVMEGQIVSLQGNQFLARVADGSGSVLNLHANLNIDSNSGAVTGSLSASAG
jgi:methionine sulfoxide reductase heme-binding subunit